MKKSAILLCLALSACIGAGKRGAAPMAVYDLGAPAGRQAAAAVPLAVEVRAPDWFDTPAIQYRLAYAEPGRLRGYGRARWAAAPAQLVQQRLVQQLGLVAHGQGGAKCLLRVDIDEFSQVFATPASSHGVLVARVALLDGSRKALAERRVRFEEPAPSQDSLGGVAALAAAVGRLAGELDAWRTELAAGERLRSCG